jgi:hypothetical protein
MPRETISQKAERLLRESSVTQLTISIDHGVGVYAVKGDTMSYLVTVLSPDLREEAQRLGVTPGNCPCEARGMCSHLLAADAMYRAQTL